MRLTLVNTATDGLNRGLGTMALQAYLRALPELSAWQLARVEIPYPAPWWNPQPFDDATVQAVLDTEPDVLGLSLVCWDLDAQLALAQRVRRELRDVRIVVGGPSATARGASLLDVQPALDVVVSGEGEVPLAALLTSYPDPPAATPGIAWRRADGSVADAGGFGHPLPFDRLGSPLRSGVYEPRWLVNLELARGCARGCRYCGWRARTGGVRRASEERMRAEIAAACRHEVTTACLLDSAVNADPTHLRRLTRAVSAADPGGRLGWRGFVDVATLDDEQAAALSKLRIEGAEVSLNSVNAAALEQAGRAALTPRELDDRLDLLAPVAPFDLHLILGLPGDDLAGFRRTLDYVGGVLDRFGPGRLPCATVFWRIVEHGTWYWRRRARLGLSIAHPGTPYVLSAAGFPTPDLVAAARHVVEHRHADRFRLDGPRALLEGVVPENRRIT